MNRYVTAALAGLLGLAGAAVAAPGTPALAAPTRGGLAMVSASITPPAGSALANGSAQCRPGFRMVGSGVFSDGGVIQELAPNADYSGATVAVATTRPVQLTLMCAPAEQFGDVSTVAVTDHRITAGVLARGLAQCPAGDFAFGGGGYFADGAGRRVTGVTDNVSNTPSADGTAWTYAGATPPGATRLVVLTQCAPRTGRDAIVQSGTPAKADNQLVRAVALCPAGYTPIAGGFYVSRPDGSEATPAAVQVSKMSPDPWQPTADTVAWQALGNVPYAMKLVALAQCLRD